MKQEIPSKKQKSFGSGLTVDKLRARNKTAGGQKPRPIKSPGSRAGLKKGAGG